MNDLSYQELDDACIISAVCRDATEAVVYLTQIMSDSRTYSAFTQYAKASRLTLKVMYKRETEHNFKISKALREGGFYPLLYSPELSENKKRLK